MFQKICMKKDVSVVLTMKDVLFRASSISDTKYELLYVKDTKKIFSYFSGNSNSSSQGPTPVIRLPDRCHCAANDQVW